MTRRLLVEPEAAAELEDAARWYEARAIGLGTASLTSVDITLTDLARWPEAGTILESPTTDPPLRRAPVRTFPYHVVYLPLDDALRILAVAHDRRRPDYRRQRLTQ